MWRINNMWAVGLVSGVMESHVTSPSSILILEIRKNEKIVLDSDLTL